MSPRPTEIPSRMLQPIRIGGVELRNRVLSAPMERNLAGRDGLIGDEYIAYLEARAAGGVALTFAEAAYIRIDGKGRQRQMGVDSDETIPGIARLADAVHRHGALLGVQLNHGGRTSQGRVSGFNCVAPSPIPCEVAGGELPIELDEEEIHDLIDCYAAAARRCAEAGVDVLSVHAAHGYLIHQFMSPRTNRRADAWADPLRFVIEVITAVRAAAPELAIGMRISATEGVPDGLDFDATFELVARTPLQHLDFLDVSAGSYEAGQWTVQSGEWPEGVLGVHAARYRPLGLPVSVAGRITRAATVEELLTDSCDLVSIGRALHADPDWAMLVATGQKPRPCIACNLCIDELKSAEPVSCSVNPIAGKESQVGVGAVDPARPQAQGSRQTVMIIGAGPAGLEAACKIAEAGYRVRMVERRSSVGGELALAASLHEYPEYGRILRWYAHRLEALRVETRFETSATVELIQSFDPDAIILATGGRGVIPDIPGGKSPRVTEVREWIAAGAQSLGDELHVIWGADREGVAVADELRARGKRLCIIGGQHELAPDVGRRAKILVVPRLTTDPNVEIVLETRIRAITPASIEMSDATGERSLALSGPILVSQGLTPDTSLQQALRDSDVRTPVLTIGEAAGCGGSIANAIADGFHAAAHITGSLPARGD